MTTTHFATQSATSAAPPTSMSFAARIYGPMPRGLRQEADAMTFEAFHDRYASSSGVARLALTVEVTYVDHADRAH